MKILISGCDASLGPDTWVDFLPYKDITNLSCAGADSQYIHDSVMLELNKNSYDLMIVMWPKIKSGTERQVLMHMLALQDQLKQHMMLYVYTYFCDYRSDLKSCPNLYHQLDQARMFDGVLLGELTQRNQWFASDGVRPGKRAHQLWATNLLNYIKIMPREQSAADKV